jgi:hypothetical protein
MERGYRKLIEVEISEILISSVLELMEQKCERFQTFLYSLPEYSPYANLPKSIFSNKVPHAMRPPEWYLESTS